MDQLSKLYEAAEGDDDARRYLDTLAIRAGLAWQCSNCPWVNRVGSGTCRGCGEVASTAEIRRLREALERVYQTGRGPHVEIAREALDA